MGYIEELLYSDLEGEYFLLDYSPSHSEMIIRKINKNPKHNIDLFFKAVYHICLNTRLSGIKVFKTERKDKSSLINPAKRIEIFKIMDNTGFVSYIDASIFVVFHNHLDILVSSLGDFTWSKENQEIFSSEIY
jgi:hypothetical protein